MRYLNNNYHVHLKACIVMGVEASPTENLCPSIEHTATPQLDSKQILY